MKRISINQAISDIDKIFNVTHNGDEADLERSWRDNDRTYYVRADEFTDAEVIGKLHEYFREREIEDTICNLLDKDEEYTIFQLA